MDAKQYWTRASERWGGCLGLPVLNSPYGLCEWKATWKKYKHPQLWYFTQHTWENRSCSHFKVSIHPVRPGLSLAKIKKIFFKADECSLGSKVNVWNWVCKMLLLQSLSLLLQVCMWVHARINARACVEDCVCVCVCAWAEDSVCVCRRLCMWGSRVCVQKTADHRRI